jgi:hypothetical protein
MALQPLCEIGVEAALHRCRRYQRALVHCPSHLGINEELKPPLLLAKLRTAGPSGIRASDDICTPINEATTAIG